MGMKIGNNGNVPLHKQTPTSTEVAETSTSTTAVSTTTSAPTTATPAPTPTPAPSVVYEPSPSPSEPVTYSAPVSVAEPPAAASTPTLGIDASETVSRQEVKSMLASVTEARDAIAAAIKPVATKPSVEPVAKAEEPASTYAQLIAQASSQMVLNVGGSNRAVIDLIKA